MDAISVYFLVAKGKQSHYFFISSLSPLYHFSLPFCSYNTVLERKGYTISLKVTSPDPLPTQLLNPQHTRKCIKSGSPWPLKGVKTDIWMACDILLLN